MAETAFFLPPCLIPPIRFHSDSRVWVCNGMIKIHAKIHDIEANKNLWISYFSLHSQFIWWHFFLISNAHFCPAPIFIENLCILKWYEVKEYFVKYFIICVALHCVAFVRVSCVSFYCLAIISKIRKSQIWSFI